MTAEDAAHSSFCQVAWKIPYVALMSGNMQDAKYYTIIKHSPGQLPINHILVDWLLLQFSILLDQQKLEVSNVLLSKIF